MWLICFIVTSCHKRLMTIWAMSQENLFFGGLQSGKTQTGLLSYKGQLESWKFEFSKYRNYTIWEANSKGTDQTGHQPAHLLFAYNKSQFCHDMAHMLNDTWVTGMQGSKIVHAKVLTVFYWNNCNCYGSKTLLKQSHDKHNLSLMVISYGSHETHQRLLPLISFEMMTLLSASL